MRWFEACLWFLGASAAPPTQPFLLPAGTQVAAVSLGVFFFLCCFLCPVSFPACGKETAPTPGCKCSGTVSWDRSRNRSRGRSRRLFGSCWGWGGFGVVPRLCSRFWCPAVSWWQWGCAPWQDTSWVSPGVPWGAQPRSPLLFPSAVTSEQIEHLHRRFRQLSRDQLTIRYGVPLPAAGRPPPTFFGCCGGMPGHAILPSRPGKAAALQTRRKRW